MLARLHTRPPATTPERIRPSALMLNPDAPPIDYTSSMRRRVSPTRRPVLFTRPQVYTYQTTSRLTSQEYAARLQNPPMRLADNPRPSMDGASSSLVDHAMEIENNISRSRERERFLASLGSRFPGQTNTLERPQTVPRADVVSITQEQPVFHDDYWRDRSDEDMVRASNHRRTASLADLRRDINEMSSMVDDAVDARRRHEARDMSPRRPESINMADFVYLDVPSLPSPGLGEIFDHAEPTNHVMDRDFRSGPFNEMRNAPQSSVDNTMDRGDRMTSSFPHRDARSSHHPPTFPMRRRSPSPTREEQGSWRPPPSPPRAGPSITVPTSSRPAMTIDLNSFAPGPFRNTLERLVNINPARENRAAPPPSIPPLAFETNTSHPQERFVPPMRLDPSSQVTTVLYLVSFSLMYVFAEFSPLLLASPLK
jgi:hypothetical protein